MRLSDKAKQPVHPRDFWLAVGAAVVLIGIICVDLGPQKHFSAGSWFWAAGLVVMWSVNLWRLFRFGRQVLPCHKVLILLGFTLISGEHIGPPLSAAGDWAISGGTLLLLVGASAPWFSSDPRPKSSSDAA